MKSHHLDERIRAFDSFWDKELTFFYDVTPGSSVIFQCRAHSPEELGNTNWTGRKKKKNENWKAGWVGRGEGDIGSGQTLGKREDMFKVHGMKFSKN